MSKRLPSVTIVRRIKAPPARIWAAITQPKLMMQWWGPDAGPTLSAEADVRPGGRFSVVFRLLNGEEHNPTGIYQEVVPEKKLVFTWEWPGMPERESLVTFVLEPSDGGTELTLLHGLDSYIFWGSAERQLDLFAQEVVPRVREQVARERRMGMEPSPAF